MGLALNLPLETRVAPRPKRRLARDRRRLSPTLHRELPEAAGIDLRGQGWIERAARPAFLRDGRLRETPAIDAVHWEELIRLASGPRRGRGLGSAEVWCRLSLEDAAPAAVESELWARRTLMIRCALIAPYPPAGDGRWIPLATQRICRAPGRLPRSPRLTRAILEHRYRSASGVHASFLARGPGALEGALGRRGPQPLLALAVRVDWESFCARTTLGPRMSSPTSVAVPGTRDRRPRVGIRSPARSEWTSFLSWSTWRARSPSRNRDRLRCRRGRLSSPPRSPTTRLDDLTYVYLFRSLPG